jgi:hypothetical protein
MVSSTLLPYNIKYAATKVEDLLCPCLEKMNRLFMVWVRLFYLLFWHSIVKYSLLIALRLGNFVYALYRNKIISY